MEINPELVINILYFDLLRSKAHALLDWWQIFLTFFIFRTLITPTLKRKL
jgi:hypothetical protein